jgi:hypothetical protein
MKTCAEIEALAKAQQNTMREIGKKLADEILQANTANMEAELTDKGHVSLIFESGNSKYSAALRTNSLRDSSTNRQALAEIVAMTVAAMLRDLGFFSKTVRNEFSFCVKTSIHAYDGDDLT